MSVQVCHGAHADSEVTSFAFSKDDNTLLSRSADETLKVRHLLADQLLLFDKPLGHAELHACGQSPARAVLK